MKSEDEEKYPPSDTGPSVESMKNEAIEAIEAMVNNSEENTISCNNVENTFKGITSLYEVICLTPDPFWEKIPNAIY